MLHTKIWIMHIPQYKFYTYELLYSIEKSFLFYALLDKEGENVKRYLLLLIIVLFVDY
jgi:hypothetical protein